jgi:hypothetical protein
MPERAARASAERRATEASRGPTRPVLVKSERYIADGPRGKDRLRVVERPRLVERPRDLASPRATKGSGEPGRRTVVIRGQVSDRYSPRRRSQPNGGVVAGYYRPRPDRAAKWAVLLGFLLVLVALLSAHL